MFQRIAKCYVSKIIELSRMIHSKVKLGGIKNELEQLSNPSTLLLA